MGRGSRIVQNHINGFQEEIQRASIADAKTFFNWFDESGGDVDATFLKGQCEFTFYIMLPLLGMLQDLSAKTALEIGYGGGRLLAAAAQAFGRVVGVDIHRNAHAVAQELKRRRVNNFELLTGDGKTIPVADSSVDLVYSFIVFQHLETIAIFKSYVAEAYRVLRKGGYAVLFFGRLSTLSVNRQSKCLYYLDRVVEAFDRKGYREMAAQVNCTNLRVAADYARREVEQQGFTVLAEGASRKLPTARVYGGQTFFVLRKTGGPAC